MLEPDIERFLYLDGDIDITGALDSLLALPMPSGGFLAAPDVARAYPKTKPKIHTVLDP